jgi:uncharacterized protein
MNELDFALETKALDDEGHIEGLAVGYGNLDFGGDVVLPGAIKSMAGKAIPMLMFHDHKRPAGVWTQFEETSEGLLAKGRFSMSTTAGKEAHGLVKDGALGGLSMGYRTLKHRIVGKARHLAEIALHEISLVTIPMNEKTLILSVKDIVSGGEMPTERQFEIRGLSAGCRRFFEDEGGANRLLGQTATQSGGTRKQGG